MPFGLALFGISFVVLLIFVLLLWAVNYVKGWRPSHMSSEATKRPRKWRLSANKIVAMVGGDRTHVLAVIWQVRELAPVFPPLSQEQ